MDGISALASIVNIVDFGAKLAQLISRLHDTPRFLRSLNDSVQSLRSVLLLIQEEFRKPDITSSDQQHAQVIQSITEECNKLIAELRERLPVINVGDDTLRRLRVAWEGFNADREFREKDTEIRKYAFMLQISLSALTSRRASRIEAGLGALQEKIDQVVNAPPYPGEIDDDKMSQNVQAWRSSLSPYLTSNDSVGGGQQSEERFISDEIDEELESKNRELSRSFESRGMFLQAARALERIIERRRAQVDIQFEEEVRALEESRADLLSRCFTMERHQEALDIFGYLLRQATSGPRSDASDERKARLQLKMAFLYQNEDGLGKRHNPDEARKLLTQAVDVFYNVSPLPKEALLRAGTALIDMLRAREEHDIAESYQRRILGKVRLFHSDIAYEVNWDNYRNVSNESVLGWCASQGFDAFSRHFRFDIVQSRAVMGEEPRNSSTSPLHLAVQQKKEDMVQAMLVEVENVDVLDNDYMSPLMLAARSRRSDIANILLEYEASTAMKRDGQTVLHFCQEGDRHNGRGVAVLFLDHDQSLTNQQNKQGRTALHLASAKGHKRMTELLLSRNAALNIQDEYGKTALQLAVENAVLRSPRHGSTASRPSVSSGTTTSSGPRPGVIESLLSSGADVTISDNVENTPLHTACTRGNVEAVRMILSHARMSRTDSSVNKAGPRGQTPVIAATLNGYRDIVRDLIDGGANPEHQDDTGRSARDYAKREGVHRHEMMVALQGTPTRELRRLSHN
ncbi:uncharacterized protein JN550_010567 [Neoarthrinium moseri]|uniref:uncharacterized protein n=1 Tax=Neoarthrinium moseri TaxID=1658444 RepID=UPI001FDB8F08|nr:uncharacterized protein JN550_010567 [Neoarthrinium moseri]KAI1862102.1 hypothetical protein JN550_010567 [Neoarthrinium moseri]